MCDPICEGFTKEVLEKRIKQWKETDAYKEWKEGAEKKE